MALYDSALCAIRDGQWDKLSKVTSHIAPVWWKRGMDIVEEPTCIARWSTVTCLLQRGRKLFKGTKLKRRPVQIWKPRWAEAMKNKYGYSHPRCMATVKNHVPEPEILGTLHVDSVWHWCAVGSEVVPAARVGRPKKVSGEQAMGVTIVMYDILKNGGAVGTDLVSAMWFTRGVDVSCLGAATS
eukprot:3081708-Amphidinium_carterae.1